MIDKRGFILRKIYELIDILTQLEEENQTLKQKIKELEQLISK